MDIRRTKIEWFVFLVLWFFATTFVYFYILNKGEAFLFPHNVIAAAILYSPCLILGWLIQGPLLGITILSLCCLSTIFFSAASGFYAANIILFLYVGASAIPHFYYQMNKARTREELVKIEELEESINTLQEEHKKENVLTDSLKKRFDKYNSLKDVTARMGSLLSLNSLADYITEQTFNIIGKSDTCLLYLIDEVKQELALYSKKSSRPGVVVKSKKGDMFDSWVLKHRSPLLVGDARKDFRFSVEKDDEYKREFVSVISAPLMAENRTLGILRLDAKDADIYTADDLRLLDILSDLAAVSIKNGILYQKTEELAIRDGLTGLYVQRYFKQRLEEELERASRNASLVSLMILDIDFFKNYNDNYGHTAGDIVLRRVADILKSSLGAENVVARYGGEEFAAILPGVSKEKAVNMAEKIRSAIESEIFLLRRKETKVTVSIGLSTYPLDSPLKEALLQNADNSLYSAKNSGRNRICAA